MSKPKLSVLLRAWRGRMAPADIGITVSGDRPVIGLHRDELARLAGLSHDYLVSLEQGHVLHPTPQVVDALARALHLDRVEEDGLYKSAGLSPPSGARISAYVPPEMRRLVIRLRGNPAGVFRPDWTLVSWNPLWSALHGDPIAIHPARRNVVRAMFGDDEVQRFLRTSRPEGGGERFHRALVADLRHALATYPSDPELAVLVHHLRETSAHFERLWNSGEAAHHDSVRRTFEHPDVGDIALSCDVLTIPGTDLRLIVYSAPENTSEATKLDFLRVLDAWHVDGPYP